VCVCFQAIRENGGQPPPDGVQLFGGVVTGASPAAGTLFFFYFSKI
jgi:hypothetical protein